jgi:hypothetical protein
MEVTKEDLAERFSALSDDALLERVRAGTLTPLALAVALDELRSRGIDVTTVSDSQEQEYEYEASEDFIPDVDLVTVARFSNPMEANVLRACLESHGIFVFVWGEHLGVAHAFLSVASGGMRVQVRLDQVEQAKEVIAAVERGDFKIDEEAE